MSIWIVGIILTLIGGEPVSGLATDHQGDRVATQSAFSSFWIDLGHEPVADKSRGDSANDPEHVRVNDFHEDLARKVPAQLPSGLEKLLMRVVPDNTERLMTTARDDRAFLCGELYHDVLYNLIGAWPGVHDQARLDPFNSSRRQAGVLSGDHRFDCVVVYQQVRSSHPQIGSDLGPAHLSSRPVGDVSGVSSSLGGHARPGRLNDRRSGLLKGFAKEIERDPADAGHNDGGGSRDRSRNVRPGPTSVELIAFPLALLVSLMPLFLWLHWVSQRDFSERPKGSVPQRLFSTVGTILMIGGIGMAMLCWAAMGAFGPVFF